MSAYDVGRATEARMLSIAPGVAKALGGWRVHSDPDNRMMVELHHPTAAGLSLVLSAHYPNAHKGRIAVSGRLPTQTCHGEGVTSHGIDKAEITVAAGRDADAIAKEISRRCLPAYVAAVAAMRARIAEAETEREQLTGLASRLAAICDAEVDRDGSRFRLPDAIGSMGQVVSRGDSVRFEATLTPEQAEAALRALAALARRCSR